MNSKLRWLKAATFVLILVVCAWVGAQLVAGGQLSLEGLTATLHAAVEKNFLLAAVLYLLVATLGASLLALPGFMFALLAGAVFGPVWGSMLCWAAVSLGAVLAFLLGRYLLRDALTPMLENAPVLKRTLFSSAHTADMYVLALTRLVPIFPYNLQNYAYGITGISLGRYTLFSTLFLLPGTCVYTLGSAGVANEQVRAVCLVLAVVLLVVTLVAARLLKRRANL